MKRVAPAAHPRMKGRGENEMPDVTVKRVEDFEAIFGGGFRRARAGLGVSSFGLAVMDLPANFSHYPEHDQTHDDQEEVYTVLSGRVTLRVGGEDHELEPGVFARVGAAEKRKLITGDEPARVLAMGATPGKIYEPPEFSIEGSPPPPMEKSKNATPA
jgi:mannose-6-phosphate isomerase-like protein (cupin superfamily)